MRKTRSLLQWAGILATVVIVSVYGIEARGVEEKIAAPGDKRSDVVVIDTLAEFGNLEEPEVVFFHDRHTKAMKEQGKDCSVCHMKDEKGALSIRFMRLKDTSFDDGKKIYHDGCISCHAEGVKGGQKSGPTDVDCRACHTGKAKAEAVADMTPYGMDNSLHGRHVKAQAALDGVKEEETCGSCHHKYNENDKKLYYAKGEEGTCRYCHKEQAGKDVSSFREASHESCVRCHYDLSQKKEKAGPYDCAGCHALENQEKIEKLVPAPRIPRNQPDVVLLTSGEKLGKTVKVDTAAEMGPVAFDHKLHEQANDTCRVCHTGEESMKEGFDWKKADMHDPRSMDSCVGCHKARQADPKCAGCHDLIVKKPLDNSSCAKCHMAPAKKGEEVILSMEEMTEIAKGEIESRKGMTESVDVNEIPEKVVIKGLVDKYEAAEFPHRKIVLTMMKDMKDDKLAGYFHGDTATLCQGCHHNSPAGAKPPKCSSCHGKAFADQEPARPGLKGAYHLQCIGCHTSMKLEKPKATACVECHKERKN